MNDNQLQQLLQAINTLQDLGKVAYFNKGAYNSETTYEINDVVTYQGSSYVSLGNNNQGNLPTNATYWSVVALKGDKGDTGKPFVIEKTYISIQEMVADYDNMNVNDYVMISGSIEDEQNATLWTKRETPAPTYKWVYLADFSGASGITGQTPNIQIGNVTEGNEPAVTRRQGSTNENPILDFVLKTGAKGDTGATGNGISQVSKTSTSGLTDTYTIEYTSGNSTTFDVTNGKGITSIAKTSTSGLVDTYTITYNDGTTSTFTITNGEDGEVTQAQLDETNNQVAKANMVYNALPKVSDEGDSLTLDGTANCPMKMELKGNTEQTTYTGKNLINFPYYETTKTVNGITFTVKNDGTIHVEGTASARAEFLLRNRDKNLSITEGETYTLATSGLGIVDNTLWLDTYGQTGNFLDEWTLPQTSTYTSAVAQSKDIKPLLRIAVANGATVNRDVKVWLYKGSYDETTTYEPYVGGTPSPSPDYPQDVRVVTSNNSVNVIGKNLFDTTKYSSTANVTILDKNNGVLDLEGVGGYYEGVSQAFNVIPNQSYVLSYNAQIIDTSVASACYVRIREKDDTTVIATNYNSGNQTISFTPTTDEINIHFRVNGETNRGHSKYSNIQLEKGNQVTSYTPYVSQTYPVNLGTIELCKIDTYQDYIYKENNKWYLEKNVGKETNDGSIDEHWGKLNREINGYYGFRHNGSYSEILLCDKLTNYTTTQLYNGIGEGIGFSNTGSYLAVYIKSERVNSYDVTDLRTFLANNPITYYYQLSTPTTTEITDTTLISQLNAIENAVSYDTQTNIVQEYYSEPFIINVECVRSLKDIFELIGNS